MATVSVPVPDDAGKWLSAATVAVTMWLPAASDDVL
jgi:hypothetical protein